MAPLVAIVIVTWNKRADVLVLLDSLQQLTSDDVRIIVVDNASTDGSAEAIRQHPLAVTLLENVENLGGSGGFNTGIRHALNEYHPEYVWLLDNDAQVTDLTLKLMIAVLEDNPNIAVAGSCIMSPEDQDLIVEAGGFVDERAGFWLPNRRYERHVDCRQECRVEPVDYVSACSAVIRANIFAGVGLLDERYFLHWDDIDFCARVRETGMKVVSVLDAPVYHGAEKGYSAMTLYYDFRNALLYFSGHAVGWRRARVIIAILRKYLTACWYLRLLGKPVVAAYLLSGLTDFIARRFGRSATSPLAVRQELETSIVVVFPSARQRIVVFATGSFDEVSGVVRMLKSVCSEVRISVAAPTERLAMYRLPEVDRLIAYDLAGDGIARKLAIAFKLFFGGYDCGVSTGSGFVAPYSFLLRHNIRFCPADATFCRMNESVRSFWKLPAVLMLGCLSVIRYLAPVLARAESIDSGTTKP